MKDCKASEEASSHTKRTPSYSNFHHFKVFKVEDPHHFNAAPDTAFHLNADPDLTFTLIRIQIRTFAYFCGLFFLPVFGSNPDPDRLTLKLLIMWRAHTCRSRPSWQGRRMRGAGCPPPPASTPPRTPRRPKWPPSHRLSATWTSTGTQHQYPPATVAPNIIHVCDDTSEYGSSFGAG
jgi:hypothetical protein